MPFPASPRPKAKPVRRWKASAGAAISIAGRIPNLPDPLTRWLMDPPAMKPGTLMPNVGVSFAEARHMAAYLYTIK
jgi:hypothetical protein